MTIDALIMLAGALVAVLPFLGFPRSWDTVFFFILGVCVFALGVVVRRTGIASGKVEKRPAKNSTMFSESQPVSHAGESQSPRHDEAAS